MAWTDDQWGTFATLLRRGWPGDFPTADAKAYRVLLDDTDPAVAVDAIRRLLHAGNRFRPSAAEILGAANTDPSRPTFDEAYRLIFGSRGVLKARPDHQRFRDVGEHSRARRQAALDRAQTMHPLVASFVATQDPDRLRELPLDDPDWGRKHRADLEDAWNRHVEANTGRTVAALASGRRGELARLDPLAALGIPAAAQLTEGDAA